MAYNVGITWYNNNKPRTGNGWNPNYLWWWLGDGLWQCYTHISIRCADLHLLKPKWDVLTAWYTAKDPNNQPPMPIRLQQYFYVAPKVAYKVSTGCEMIFFKWFVGMIFVWDSTTWIQMERSLGSGSASPEVYDTVAYMSVPATIFLVPFAVLLGDPRAKGGEVLES